ncbi:MAG: cyanophycinase [Herminiimonas sp.]|nr:cyanophycinase [Herminiimonas sp.]
MKEAASNSGHGHLVIIGGGEDRSDDKEILRRFIALAGGVDRKIVVITAASKVADHMWDIYDKAFGDMGVTNRVPIHVASRADANRSDLARQVASADGIFMTGGDQRRLLAIIGGTELDAAMHHALKLRGACIAGTSAGASAMSGHMLADGSAELQPEKGSVNLGAGLGFLQRVVIDQHFSERRRLARLLTVVSQNPYLLGIGIDENTALVVERGVGIEVIGDGAVTIVDGRTMISNINDIKNRHCPEMIDVRLHLLPGGSRYALHEDEHGVELAHSDSNSSRQDVPLPLKDFLRIVTKRNPIS